MQPDQNGFTRSVVSPTLRPFKATQLDLPATRSTREDGRMVTATGAPIAGHGCVPVLGRELESGETARSRPRSARAPTTTSALPFSGPAAPRLRRDEGERVFSGTPTLLDPDISPPCTGPCGACIKFTSASCHPRAVLGPGRSTRRCDRLRSRQRRDRRLRPVDPEISNHALHAAWHWYRRCMATVCGLRTTSGQGPVSARRRPVPGRGDRPHRPPPSWSR